MRSGRRWAWRARACESRAPDLLPGVPRAACGQLAGLLTGDPDHREFPPLAVRGILSARQSERSLGGMIRSITMDQLFASFSQWGVLGLFAIGALIIGAFWLFRAWF